MDDTTRTTEPEETTPVAEEEEFSAAAPPDPAASGAGETSFADADAPPASEAKRESEDKAHEYLELAKRTKADFENYRKRMARENAAAVDRGVAKLAKELLPALDHLELALKAAEGHQEAGASGGAAAPPVDVLKGFSMVGDELQAALGRVGIQSFAPHGEPFDPNEHEAMASQPREGVESGTVVEVYQSGYRINGAVLRPARVVVAA
jgi:molecular chaperone GrpE